VQRFVHGVLAAERVRAVQMVIAAAGLSLALATPAPQRPAAPYALQPAATAPIRLRSCSISISKAGSVIWVDFVDRSTVAANEVIVRGDASTAAPFEVTDVGTFSPGIDIEHVFRPPRDAALTSVRRLSCVVAYARFADGTTWSR
jgi:hypothetical protein